MKQRMMKLVALLACASMVVGSFAACGGNSEEQNDPTPTPTAKPTDAPDNGDEGKENEGFSTDGDYDFGGVKVRVYGSIWNDVDSTELAKIEAVEAIEKKYNIDLVKAEITGYEDTWDDQIVTSVSNGDPIVDIITLPPDALLSCMMTGLLYDMTDEIGDMQIGKIYTDAGTWLGKCYGISYDNLGDAYCLIYDRDYVKEIGMEKTPTDMFMEGKWSYKDFEQYCADMKAKLPENVYPIGQYPYHWGVMAAGANGTAICDMDCNLGLLDDGFIECLEFYRGLEEKGLAYPMKQTTDPEGNTVQDIVYSIADSRPGETRKIVMCRAEAWELSSVGYKYGVTFWPWGSQVTIDESKIGQPDAYTTLSDNYKVITCYWGTDCIVNDSCEKRGIPGDVMMKIIYDYRAIRNGDDGNKFMHDAYESEKTGNPVYGNALGEARSFHDEQDIELYDWAHGRFKADISWSMASAEIFSAWKATADVTLRYMDARSAMESYMQTAKAALADAGVVVPE